MTAVGQVDSKPVLRGLKDFQRRTVDYVFRRLYLDDPPARHFLVADEVGLGKTLVARGLIARSIEHLQRQGVERIDIVYICSNADIARQNINRLNVTGRQEFNLPTRITMLPLYLRQLRTHGINFVSFTPGTSFDLKSRSGMVPERALLYWLLHHAWGWRRERHMGVFRVLRGSAGLDNFRRAVRDMPHVIGTRENHIDPGLAAAFRAEMDQEASAAQQRGEQGLEQRFEELADRHQRSRFEDWESRQALVGALRHTLARSCVNALEPDLVVLDEFQRFRHLLDENDPAAELAQHLFAQEHARVLLLSATPYKMYTLPEEGDVQEDHYADFVRTARFLMGNGDATRFERDLRDFRHSVTDIGGSNLEDLRRNRLKVQRRLRRVMTRTERLAVTVDRNGMLAERAMAGAVVTARDLGDYLHAQALSRQLGGVDPLEFWKSAPYLLNFMDGYKLKDLFRTGLSTPTSRAEIVRSLGEGESLLSVSDIEAYKPIDPANARLRGLIADTLDTESWRLLWLPPALTYYQLGVPYNDPQHARFTKRLVFSAWWLVPQVIATLLSYEAERRMIRAAGRSRRNTSEARKRMRPLLRFQRQGGRPSGMTSFALIYPSPALAKLADPLALSATLNREGPPTLEDILALAELRIQPALNRVLPKKAVTEGPVDERWYWVAPLLLDLRGSAEDAAWLDAATRGTWSSDAASEDESGESAFAEVLAYARETRANVATLGRVPDDLVQILARLALASPATCALRALARVAGGINLAPDPELRNGAARVGWGFRSLFNTPEVMVMLRAHATDESAYWRTTLDYCAAGGIQAVLDEYAHVLREWLGIIDRDAAVIGRELGAGMYDALTVRAASYRTDAITLGGELGISSEAKNLRGRYALRFGSQNPDDAGKAQRAGQVRTAFNSPFWPFVLATTSVGQEGLDFHLYCHAVVHWNLPANPVDLEQREGRIHRYKGHAIRKNVAAANRQAGFQVRSNDPWEAMFDAAKRRRDKGAGDLEPYWVTTGEAQIERHVPMIPLSREVQKLDQLKRSLAVYRMAFGQPRQDDLTAFLADLPEERRLELANELRIDLSPG